MKNLVFTLVLATALFSCKNEKPPVSEVDAARSALEQKRTALKDKQDLARMESEMAQLDAEIQKMNGFAQRKATAGTITGSDVIVRAANSAQSEKLGNFTERETVAILQKQVSLTNNEGVLLTDIKTSGGTFQKGSAVVINAYDGQNDTYEVAQNNLVMNLPAYLVQKSVNENWYQIRRTTGQTGWVFGKFLREI